MPLYFVLRGYACVISINIFHARSTAWMVWACRISRGGKFSTKTSNRKKCLTRDLKSYYIYFVQMIQPLYINCYIVEWLMFLARNICTFDGKKISDFMHIMFLQHQPNEIKLKPWKKSFFFTENWMQTSAKALWWLKCVVILHDILINCRRRLIAAKGLQKGNSCMTAYST